MSGRVAVFLVACIRLWFSSARYEFRRIGTVSSV
jgi:hypothetical protein